MNQTFYEQLQTLLSKEQIFIDEPMKKHTTFRVGGPADFFVTPTKEQLQNLLLLAKKEQVPITIIGNGSNLLVSDAGVRGLVIQIGPAMGNVIVDGEQLTMEAGALLSKAAHIAAEHSLTGMEFAAGIPGSLGGAVVMNAGAYGGEMKDILVSVTVLTQEGQLQTLPVEELDLSYRHSKVLDWNAIVIEATVALRKSEQAAIYDLMEDLKGRRVEKQPLEYPSAGSTFKRPKGYFAGKLIQDAGLCGYRVGDAQVSEKHCGFVINRGKATATEIHQLIADVQEKVFEQFQVHLEPEVKMIGE